MEAINVVVDDISPETTSKELETLKSGNELNLQESNDDHEEEL